MAAFRGHYASIYLSGIYLQKKGAIFDKEHIAKFGTVVLSS